MGHSSLRGKSAAVVLFSYYPMDPRPRRAAEALVKEGMKVEVICLRESDSERTRETVNGVDVRRLPLQRRRGGGVGYVVQYVTFLAMALGILAARSFRRRYHLVHVHNMPDILVLSALVPKALGAKVILDLHDPMPELMMTIFGLDGGNWKVRLLRRLEKWSIKRATLALTVNARLQAPVRVTELRVREDACRHELAGRGDLRGARSQDPRGARRPRSRS